MIKYGIVYVPYLNNNYDDPWCKRGGRIERTSLNDIYIEKELAWSSSNYEVKEIQETTNEMGR